ncbi:MAG: hypothetical protein V1645_02205 [archaeon]
MNNKRGQGISMEFIIIAAIALIVLIVIILFFTGGLEKIFGGQKEIVGSVSDQQKEIWRSNCRLYCSLGQKENFVNKEFLGADKTVYRCKDPLKVECGECKDKGTGIGAGCSQYRDKTDCEKVAEKCTWTDW